jgi:hypothetical protein
VVRIHIGEPLSHPTTVPSSDASRKAYLTATSCNPSEKLRHQPHFHLPSVVLRRAFLRSRGSHVRIVPGASRGVPAEATIPPHIRSSAVDDYRFRALSSGAWINPELKAMYEPLRRDGKPSKLAFGALARKRLTILNAIVRDQTQWKTMSAQRSLATRLLVMRKLGFREYLRM